MKIYAKLISKSSSINEEEGIVDVSTQYQFESEGNIYINIAIDNCVGPSLNVGKEYTIEVSET